MSAEPTDGFITRDGELVPLEDAERIYELAQSWFDTPPSSWTCLPGTTTSRMLRWRQSEKSEAKEN